MSRLFKAGICLALLIIAGCNKASSSASGEQSNNTEPLFRQPYATLSPAGYNLIIEQETGGERYYNRFEAYPTWPEGDSAITIAIGCDLASYTEYTLRHRWQVLPKDDLNRLITVRPYRGLAAKRHLYLVKDILIRWDIAVNEFKTFEVPDMISACRRAYPGFDGLKPNAQAVLVSIAYNRGLSFVGSGRIEMRAIREDVPRKDYRDMAYQIRKMERLWPPGNSIHNGMVNRREAERRLMLTCVD